VAARAPAATDNQVRARLARFLFRGRRADQRDPGALLVASHDVPFLRDLGITRWLRLDGELTGIDPL